MRGGAPLAADGRLARAAVGLALPVRQQRRAPPELRQRPPLEAPRALPGRGGGGGGAHATLPLCATEQETPKPPRAPTAGQPTPPAPITQPHIRDTTGRSGRCMAWGVGLGGGEGLTPFLGDRRGGASGLRRLAWPGRWWRRGRRRRGVRGRRRGGRRAAHRGGVPAARERGENDEQRGASEGEQQAAARHGGNGRRASGRTPLAPRSRLRYPSAERSWRAL